MQLYIHNTLLGLKPPETATNLTLRQIERKQLASSLYTESRKLNDRYRNGLASPRTISSVWVHGYSEDESLENRELNLLPKSPFLDDVIGLNTNPEPYIRSSNPSIRNLAEYLVTRHIILEQLGPLLLLNDMRKATTLSFIDESFRQSGNGVLEKLKECIQKKLIRPKSIILTDKGAQFTYFKVILGVFLQFNNFEVITTLRSLEKSNTFTDHLRSMSQDEKVWAEGTKAIL